MVNLTKQIMAFLGKKNKTIDQSFIGLPKVEQSELQEIVKIMVDRKHVPFTSKLESTDDAVILSILSAGNSCHKGDPLSKFVNLFVNDFLTHSCSVNGLRSDQIKEMTSGYVKAQAEVEKMKIGKGSEKAELKGIV